MPERWRRDLDRLSDVEPSPGLWERALAGPQPQASNHRVSSRVGVMTVALVAVAVAGYGLWYGLGTLGRQPAGSGRDEWKQYRNPRFGWTVKYPARMLSEHFESRGLFTSDGIWIANFQADTSASAEDLRHLRKGFPRDGVLFQLWWGQRFPVHSDEPDTQLPLSLDTFEQIPRYVGGKEPRPLYKSFFQGGTPFSLAVWVGPEATAADRQAMADIVASVRFPQGFSGQTLTYTDDAYGWSMDVPLSLNSAGFEERPGNRYTLSGTWVTNFLFPTAGQPDLVSFPTDGAALRVWRRVGGPMDIPIGDDTRFPISLEDLKPQERYSGGSEPEPQSLEFIGNGLRFTVDVWFGQQASAADRNALGGVLKSIRFPPLEKGTVTGATPSFYVLDLADAYPVESVTRFERADPVNTSIAFPFYLVHAPGGFYAVGFGNTSSQLVGGYKNCDVRFDPDHFEFFCPENGARWDRLGEVLVNPDPGVHPDDPLQILLAKTAQDGHVLVSPEFGLSPDSLEGMWG
jgi:hypothetical protein